MHGPRDYHPLLNSSLLNARIKISINADISILDFMNISEISQKVDILTKISMRGKLFKIHKNAEKTQKK